MKLSVDSSILSLGHYHPRFRTGIYRVVANLAAELGSHEGVNFHSQFQLMETIPSFFPFANQEFSVPLWRRVFDRGCMDISRILSGGSLRHVKRLSQNDAILFPALLFDPRYLAPISVPTILIVHDLIALKFPEWVTRGNRSSQEQWNRLANTSLHFACVSENTRKDLLKLTDIAEERTFTCHLAPDPVFQKQSSVKPEILHKYNLESQKYFLSVGTMEIRKNLISTLRAFAAYVKESGDTQTKLALVGGSGWGNQEFTQEFIHSPVRHQVVWLGFIPDEDLRSLYQEARAFLFLSHYEGFGLPVLEALAMGCPVISSNASSLPEVGENAVLYTHPIDIPQITQHLHDLSQNPQLQDRLRTDGPLHASQFSWEKCASHLLTHFLGM